MIILPPGRQHNENIQGILSKARGFTARLSMVLLALEQAINMADTDEQDEDEEGQTRLQKRALKLLPQSWTTSSDRN